MLRQYSGFGGSEKRFSTDCSPMVQCQRRYLIYIIWFRLFGKIKIPSQLNIHPEICRCFSLIKTGNIVFRGIYLSAAVGLMRGGAFLPSPEAAGVIWPRPLTSYLFPAGHTNSHFLQYFIIGCLS